MRKSFTLIERLVVVSITALLIAILLPALAKARESGKEVVCKSNIGNIGQAQYAYVADNTGQDTMTTEWVWSKPTYPDGTPAPLRSAPTVEKQIEEGTIYPDHSELEAFICPVAADKLPRQSSWSEETFVRSDVQNAEAGPTASQEWIDKGWTEQEKLETLKAPSDFVIFNEENTFAIKGWNTFRASFTHS